MIMTLLNDKFQLFSDHAVLNRRMIILKSYDNILCILFSNVASRDDKASNSGSLR